MSKLVVAGAAGRMGQQLVQAILERDDVTLAGATEQAASPHVGADVGLMVGHETLGVKVSASIEAVDQPFDTIIDFTAPANTRGLVAFARDHGKRLIIGTTGLDDNDEKLIAQAADEIAVVYAANYSVGVTLSLELLATAARVLGRPYNIEIIEAHHKHKKDAPSGTALAMGKAVAKASGRDLGQCAVYAREGETGARDEDAIGFSTIRAGEIIGEHTVLFCGQDEQLEITHKATDRMIFARGAIRAAAWVADQPNGLYSMVDVVRPSS